jgi:Flp pilus assembly protein TadG
MSDSDLLRNQSGLAAVEFALVLPIIVTCLLGAFQLGYIGYAQGRLDAAVRQGSRVGLSGKTSGKPSRQEAIEATVEFTMSNVAKVPELPIVYTSKAYPTFSTLTQPGEPFEDKNGNGICDTGEVYFDYDDVDGRNTEDISSPGVGQPGDVVQYEITYPLDLFVPIANEFFGSDHRLDLKARTVVRNELFGAGAIPTEKPC